MVRPKLAGSSWLLGASTPRINCASMGLEALSCVRLTFFQLGAIIFKLYFNSGLHVSSEQDPSSQSASIKTP